MIQDEWSTSNKNTKKIIQKIVVTYKDRHEMLPYALHGYQTTVRTSIDATQYSMVYGIDTLMSLEIKIYFLKVLNEIKIEKSE